MRADSRARRLAYIPATSPGLLTAELTEHAGELKNDNKAISVSATHAGVATDKDLLVGFVKVAWTLVVMALLLLLLDWCPARALTLTSDGKIKRGSISADCLDYPLARIKRRLGLKRATLARLFESA